VAIRSSAPVWLPREPLVALARARLRVRLGARLGFVLTGATCVLVAVLLVAARGASEVAALMSDALVWLGWLGVGPLGLAAANARAVRDRDEGIEALVVARGHDAAALGVARALAVASMAMARMAAPALGLLGWAVLVGAAPPGGLWPLTGALLLAALAVGALVGALSAACGQWGGRRGVSLLVAAVLLPWAVADALGAPGWSLPGAIGSLVELARDAAGGAAPPA